MGHKRSGTEPAFSITVNPKTFDGMIDRQGALARILRGTVCPCTSSTSGADKMYCKLCGGKKYLYSYQRYMTVVDEDMPSEVCDFSMLKATFLPVADVISARVLRPDRQGGSKDLKVVGFDPLHVQIDTADPSVKRFQKSVTYRFDRFEYVLEEKLSVNDRVLSTVATENTLLHVHGDIAIVEKIVDSVTGWEYTDYNFSGNRIYLSENEPIPTSPIANYYYVPLDDIIMTDVNSRIPTDKSWTRHLASGVATFTIKPWYDISQSDVIIILDSEFPREQVIIHSDSGQDDLGAFEVSKVAEEIIDKDNARYNLNEDFILVSPRYLKWIGRRPNAGTSFSVRIDYRPTYRITTVNPRSRELPQEVIGSLWNMNQAGGMVPRVRSENF